MLGALSIYILWAIVGKSEKGVGGFWTRSVIRERDRLVVFVFSLKFHISNVKCQLVKDTSSLYAVGSSWIDCII